VKVPWPARWPILVVRKLFWEEGKRRRPEPHNTITEFFWRSSVWLERQPDMVETVRRLNACQPGLAIFGDALTVPAVALSTGVPVLADFADTNAQRFEAGFARYSDVAQILDAHPRTLVLLRPGGRGVNVAPEIHTYLAGRFDVIARFRGQRNQHHVLYAPIALNPHCASPVP
jgi:hypothetical protein